MKFSMFQVLIFCFHVEEPGRSRVRGLISKVLKFSPKMNVPLTTCHMFVTSPKFLLLIESHDIQRVLQRG